MATGKDKTESRSPWGDVMAIVEKPQSPEGDGRSDSDFVHIGVAWESKDDALNLTIDAWPLAWRGAPPSKLSLYVRPRKARS